MNFVVVSVSPFPLLSSPTRHSKEDWLPALRGNWGRIFFEDDTCSCSIVCRAEIHGWTASRSGRTKVAAAAAAPQRREMELSFQRFGRCFCRNTSDKLCGTLTPLYPRFRAGCSSCTRATLSENKSPHQLSTASQKIFRWGFLASEYSSFLGFFFQLLWGITHIVVLLTVLWLTTVWKG